MHCLVHFKSFALFCASHCFVQFIIRAILRIALFHVVYISHITRTVLCISNHSRFLAHCTVWCTLFAFCMHSIALSCASHLYLLVHCVALFCAPYLYRTVLCIHFSSHCLVHSWSKETLNPASTFALFCASYLHFIVLSCALSGLGDLKSFKGAIPLVFVVPERLLST